MRMEAANGISEPSFVYFSLILTKDFGFVSIRPLVLNAGAVSPVLRRRFRPERDVDFLDAVDGTG